MMYRLIKTDLKDLECRLIFSNLDKVVEVGQFLSYNKIKHTRTGFTLWMSERDYTWFVLKLHS